MDVEEAIKILKPPKNILLAIQISLEEHKENEYSLTAINKVMEWLNSELKLVNEDMKNQAESRHHALEGLEIMDSLLKEADAYPMTRAYDKKRKSGYFTAGYAAALSHVWKVSPDREAILDLKSNALITFAEAIKVIRNNLQK
jgi:hypothetical protein